MKAASVSEIKKELHTIHPDRLLELCIQMVKYKKENKEMLSYLLFDSDNELQYCNDAKIEMDELFAEMNTNTVFFAKKTLRKILRNITKYSKYSSSRRLEIDLLIHFCKRMKKVGLPVRSSQLLTNMYQKQVDKCHKILDLLHEDLQYDFREELSNL
jgi:hypothetical protein